MNYLQKWQSKNGLLADGIVGKKTLLKMQEVFGIASKEATAHFAAQVSHETANFKYGIESLNYSSNRLVTIFRKYFTPYSAQHYHRQAQKIANRVYANRMGNGDEASGDGWKYRGRGAIQLTGKNNYAAFSEFTGCDFVNNPDAVLDYYFETALWYFEYRAIWMYTHRVDKVSISRVTKLINGGYNGLDHRSALTYKYYSYLTR